MYGDFGQNITVDFENFLTCDHGLCYKITVDFIGKTEYSYIFTQFNQSKCKTMEILYILTSEPNSYGNTIGDFVDGQDLSLHGQLGTSTLVKIQPEKILHLNEIQSPKSNCNATHSYYECVGSMAASSIEYENCPRKCSVCSFPKSAHIPVCNTSDEIKCAKSVSKKHQKQWYHSCKKSCNITQFILTSLADLGLLKHLLVTSFLEAILYDTFFFFLGDFY